MTRVPAGLVLTLLHQSGHHLTPAALRKWVQRGHITRGKGGYDLREILTYLDRRATIGRDPVVNGRVSHLTAGGSPCHAPIDSRGMPHSAVEQLGSSAGS